MSKAIRIAHREYDMCKKLRSVPVDRTVEKRPYGHEVEKCPHEVMP